MVALFSCFASTAVLCASVQATLTKEEPLFSSELVFKSVSSKVGDLEARLAQMEADNKNALAKHQAQYEATLRSKQQANMELALQNSDIAKQAQDWQARNAELRKQAQELQHDTRLWQDDWSAVSLNISTALEITAATLDTFDDSKAPELQILRDLDIQDQRRKAVTDHEARLNEIMAPSAPAGRRQAALMQTSKMSKSGKQNPQALIKVLEDGLAELSASHEKKEGELMTHYFKLFQAEDKRHEALLAEGSRLNTTCTSLEGLHGRLVLAIKHLQEISAELADRGQSIRAYAQRLGSKDMPSRSPPHSKVQAARAPVPPPTDNSVHLHSAKVHESSAEEKFQAELAAIDVPDKQQRTQEEEQPQGQPADAAPKADASSPLPSWLAWMKR